MAASQRSHVWQFFDEDTEKGIVTCKMCKIQLLLLFIDLMNRHALWILLVSIEYRVSKINHGIEYRMKIRYRTSTTVCSFNPITHLIQFKCTTYKYNITNIRGAPDLVSGRIIRPDSKNHYPVHLHGQHKLYIK